MNDEKYINNITLEYLLNPILYDKIINQNNDINKLLSDDILFYRQRICKLTKDMCKGNYIENNFKKIFLNYAASIVYYLKQLDEKDILQSEYDELNVDNQIDNQTFNVDDQIDNQTLNLVDEINNQTLNVDNQHLNVVNEINNLIINQPKITNNLDHFVKRINIESKEKIIPKCRVVNINDPILKKKGLKKKNNKI